MLGPASDAHVPTNEEKKNLWKVKLILKLRFDFKDETGSQAKVLNWRKVNYDDIRQELGNVDWEAAV